MIGPAGATTFGYLNFRVESPIIFGPPERGFRGERSGVYRSGQTGQTVNLMALPSQVRILPRPVNRWQSAVDWKPCESRSLLRLFWGWRHFAALIWSLKK